MKFPFFVARRYLFSRKSHNAINIVTGISIVCVAVVTMALVIVLSAMNGLSDLVGSLYNCFNPDVLVVAEKGKTLTLNETQKTRIKKIPGLVYYAEVVEENALLEYNEQQLVVTLRGVDAAYEELAQFDTVVSEGTLELHPNGMAGAVLGREVGTRLGVGEYSSVNVFVPKRDRNLSVDLNNLEEEPFNRSMVTVSGLYTVSSDFDGKFAIVPLETVRELMNYTNECTKIEIGTNGLNSDEVAEQVKAILGNGFVVKNRFQQNELLYKTLQSEKLWTFVILVFILFIATFNIIGSLTLLIIEKKKDIGVLWSMGADKKMIQRIFFTEGLLISFVGVLLGLGLGLLICWLQMQFGFVRFDEGFVVDAYPVNVFGSDLLFIVLAVLGIGLLAAWYPVRVYTRKYLSVKI